MTDIGYWAATALAAVLGTFGIRTEEVPKYEVQREEGAAQVRAYGPQVALETPMRGMDDAASGDAFGRLAGYIFGANESAQKVAMTAPVTMEPRSEKVAMTAPVITRPEGDALVMRFVLPSKYSVATAPKPSDASVRVLEVAPEVLAAWRFSGRVTPENVAAREGELRRWLEGQGYEPAGPARLAGYDPPFTIPFLRRNEILMPVRPKS